ncbi:hypothetical protein LNQ82_07845 [Conchiformibius steedae DSM 2580]|uniref:Uncharacterized protein n=1 Tax=Conchiformibius steedae DSM 2580 TaxID=1121352 RepID=A0AAE9HXT6_9NEIS|nr:hypothetical protein [Conchiformibius steedae]QMT34322.1 hypothetical protein H3L98_04935 [Conchiformibius steedae]URD67096.1 hypothetical protein LNQ82_07845 [Conchiformibius steedae DSM 2580]
MNKKTVSEKTEFYVEEQYRTNPLSSIPAPNELKIENKIYNNIHHPDKYLAKVNQEKNSDENNYLDDCDDWMEEERKYMLENWSEYWTDFYGGGPWEGMTEEEMESFIDSQTPDW